MLWVVLNFQCISTNYSYGVNRNFLGKMMFFSLYKQVNIIDNMEISYTPWYCLGTMMLHDMK